MPTDLSSGGTITDGLASVEPFSAISRTAGQQPGHQSQQSGLAAARVPNQTGDFTGLTLKEISFKATFLLNRCDTLLTTST